MTDSSFPISTHEQPANGPYRCNHCSKSFSSTQALGGHQNAHRSEKRKQKRPQKAPSTKKKLDKYNPIKPRNGNPRLKIYLDGPFHEPIKFIDPNFRVGSYVPFAIFGSSCKCSQKVATSSPMHVARFRLSNALDTNVVVDTNSPQMKIFGKEKENDNNHGLDLSLKL